MLQDGASKTWDRLNTSITETFFKIIAQGGSLPTHRREMRPVAQTLALGGDGGGEALLLFFTFFSAVEDLKSVNGHHFPCHFNSSKAYKDS